MLFRGHRGWSNGAHDDAVNALAGAAVLCTTAPRLMKISNAFLARAKTPGRFAGPRYGHGYI